MRSLEMKLPAGWGLSLCLAAALALLAPRPAGAQTPVVAKRAAPAAYVATGPADTAGFGKAASTDSLARLRGGTQVVNAMTLNGTTAGNSAENIATGNNAISSGSFANMAGLPLVVQNTGANVLIQNAVILNVKMD